MAAQLAAKLQVPVQACSMERRDGPEYAFNDPLLENLATVKGDSDTHLILGMFFILPGRHAGEGGDVAEIIEGLIKRDHFKSIHVCPLLGEHPLLLDVLADRLKEARAG